MKDLIEKTLTEYHTYLLSVVPQTKKVYTGLNIDEINPFELTNFLIENNVPKDCWFGYDDDDNYSYVGFKIEIATTESDKLNHMINRFNNEVFRKIYQVFIDNGYKRKVYDSKYLKKFKKTVYEMFIEKDFDSLEDYYFNVYFQKVD